jgi:glycosyltransferase involved in cell wall biosynthesis
MKIIFDHQLPFMLAHGGTQIQIERTRAALENIGVEASYMEWWNEKQTADVLHQVGWVHPEVIKFARNKSWKVVITTLLTEQCNQSKWQWFVRKISIQALFAAPLPGRWNLQLSWQPYRLCDQVIVGLDAERQVLEKVYGVERRRISVIPLGLSETFLNAPPASRTENYLICTGTIGPLKNSLQLARLALKAQTPMLFLGKPFDYSSDYWAQFESLIDGRFVQHQTHVGNEAEMVEWLRKARGYVLMSRFENWSLAAHEAAACGLPLLLPDQRWARERFGDSARYWPKSGQSRAAEVLREFYDSAPQLGATGIKLHSWREVAEMLRETYSRVLSARNRP